MVRRYLICAAAALALAVPASADEPPHAAFAPAPPGTVVQNQLVYLSGEAMHSQWRAIASKKLLGSSSGTHFLQWYLSIYAIDGSTYRLQYRSPGNGGPLSAVTREPGGSGMWFPMQDMSIVGGASFKQSGVQQLVVQSHETGGDCGGAIVTVFGANAQGKVVPDVSLRNGCELSAIISRGHGGTPDALILRGPYYNSTAPMCCPTKPKATAVLSYRNGKWTQTPKYYDMYVGKLPPS